MTQDKNIVDFIAQICKNKKKLDELKNVDTVDKLRDFFRREKITDIPDPKECERLVASIGQFKKYIAGLDPDDLVKY